MTAGGNLSGGVSGHGAGDVAEARCLTLSGSLLSLGGGGGGEGGGDVTRRAASS